MDEHYKTKHAFEFYQVQELERLKQKAERLRPQIFLGGSPGSGRKR
jgi:hypothetical protein